VGYEHKTKGYRIGNFFVDCDHPLHWKVIFVMHAKNLQLIGILLLDNPQPLRRLIAPMCALFLPS
jgi:hypothetical protein